MPAASAERERHLVEPGPAAQRLADVRARVSANPDRAASAAKASGSSSARQLLLTQQPPAQTPPPVTDPRPQANPRARTSDERGCRAADPSGNRRRQALSHPGHPQSDRLPRSGQSDGVAAGTSKSSSAIGPSGAPVAEAARSAETWRSLPSQGAGHGRAARSRHVLTPRPSRSCPLREMSRRRLRSVS